MESVRARAQQGWLGEEQASKETGPDPTWAAEFQQQEEPKPWARTMSLPAIVPPLNLTQLPAARNKWPFVAPQPNTNPSLRAPGPTRSASPQDPRAQSFPPNQAESRRMHAAISEEDLGYTTLATNGGGAVTTRCRRSNGWETPFQIDPMLTDELVCTVHPNPAPGSRGPHPYGRGTRRGDAGIQQLDLNRAGC